MAQKLILNTSKSIELEYYKELKKLTNELKSEVNNIILPTLKNTSLDSKYTKDVNVQEILVTLGLLKNRYSNMVALSTDITNKLINKLNNLSRNRFTQSLKEQYGVNLGQVVNENKLNGLLQLIKENQVSLIKSIPTQFLADIERIITAGISEGLSYKTMEKQIKGIKDIKSSFGKLDNRIKLIVRNETSTIMSNLNTERAKATGILYYKFSTSQDERVRISHKVMNGKYCKISDATVYCDTLDDIKNNNWKKRSSIGGVEKAPGIDFNCRCNQLFLIPEEME